MAERTGPIAAAELRAIAQAYRAARRLRQEERMRAELWAHIRERADLGFEEASGGFSMDLYEFASTQLVAELRALGYEAEMEVVPGPNGGPPTGLGWQLRVRW